jgi:DNA mismatch endonuclease (patch repair protein)
MSSIKGKNTSPEITLRKKLWENNLKGYRIHHKKLPGTPDVVFSKQKVAIFINGCVWHRCPSCSFSLPHHNTDFWLKKFNNTKERDYKKTNELKQIGYMVLTIWECEIKKDINKVLNNIKEFLKN